MQPCSRHSIGCFPQFDRATSLPRSGLKNWCFTSPLLQLQPFLRTLQNKVNDRKVRGSISIHSKYEKLHLTSTTEEVRAAGRRDVLWTQRGSGRLKRQTRVSTTSEKTLPPLTDKMETVRTYPVQRMALIPETGSQLRIDLEAAVIRRQLQRQGRGGLLLKAPVRIQHLGGNATG